MGLLRSSLANIRTNPRLLKLPPYVSLLCMLGGIIWILLLPLDEYSRRTYISENALLPGQVHTYFHGTEQNIFRAYRHEISDVLEVQVKTAEDGSQQFLQATPQHRNQRIRDLFQNSGIKSAVQPYSYLVGGKKYEGENVYGVVHAPRGDGTESILIIAPIQNFEKKTNTNGVTLLMTLARYFSRWSLWSKDIILLVTPDTSAGPQAWIDAYLSQHNPEHVSSLPLKSGAIQGVICIDFPFNHNFHSLHISYDGINGQLPNLDLINTATQISYGQLGIPTLLQSQHLYAKAEHQHHYLNRLKVLGHGMRNQAVGHSTGAHSVFMPYHIDAITLTAIGDGWQDEMAFGRVVESLTRSLNNLLEKLHQSFFFYLLLQNNRFVSIGTYLPSAMAVGASFSIMAIYLWIKSGYEEKEEDDRPAKNTTDGAGTQKMASNAQPANESSKLTMVEKGTGKKTVWKSIDRPLLVPLALLATLYLTSVLPAVILVTSKQEKLMSKAAALSMGIIMIPIGLSFAISTNSHLLDGKFIMGAATQEHENGAPPEQKDNFSDLNPPSDPKARVPQFHMIVKGLSLLVLGLQLTVLATLNFSLSMFLGVLCTPIAFAGFYPKSVVRAKASLLAVSIFNPFLLANVATMVAKLAGYYDDSVSMTNVLRQWLETMSFGWEIWGSWGLLAGIFCVWIPAWMVATIGALSSFIYEEDYEPYVRTKKVKEVKEVKEAAKDNLTQIKQAASSSRSSSQTRKRKK